MSCSELSSSLSASAQKCEVNLSMANYMDPRARPSAIQHELEMNKCSMPMRQSLVPKLHHANDEGQLKSATDDSTENNLFRHKSLIDYLIANASSDETSYQLLSYLQTQFKRSIENKQQQEMRSRWQRRNLDNNNNQNEQNGMTKELSEETKIIEQINETLKCLEIERHKRKPQVQNASTNEQRRNKLNPFLIDFDQPQELQRNQIVYSMMSSVFNGNNNSVKSKEESLANYINLDCFDMLQSGGKLKNNGTTLDASFDRVDNGTITAAGPEHQLQMVRQHLRLSQQQMQGSLAKAQGIQYHVQQQSKLSQCSPVASLISNEGTISDHSATSSGVSTAPPGNGSANGSLKSHSPLSSTSSHSSVGSSVDSSTLNSNHRTLDSLGLSAKHHHSNKTNLRDNSADVKLQPYQYPEQCRTPSSTQQMNSSIAATLERRRRVQPITELSVDDLLAVADDQLGQGRDQAVAGFDHLVSQFDANKRKQEHVKTNMRQNKISGSGKQQPNSFFHELAQRLPKGRSPLTQLPESEPKIAATLQIATSGPIDTNGLPIVDSESTATAQRVAQNNVPSLQAQQTRQRTITDHYSTVNKAHKSQQQKSTDGNSQQVVSVNEQDEEAKLRLREQFFALTAPLLDLKHDKLTATTSTSDLRRVHTTQVVAGQSQQQTGTSQGSGHPSQIMRPTSSLSIFAGNVDDTFHPKRDNQHLSGCSGPHENKTSSLHGSFSTNSLNRAHIGVQDTSQLLLQPTTSCLAMSQKHQDSVQQQTHQQKPLTRPAKSVSFDPNVKDPPSSSGSMTLGRACALKSALKQQFQHQQQLQIMDHASSTATMPASFAAQLKADSVSAYRAHYDEFGRRIRLSTLLQQQQSFCDPTMNIPVFEQDQQGTLNDDTSKQSFSSLGTSLLSKLGQQSRGGRREERNMRNQQQTQLHPQQVSVVQNQPRPLLDPMKQQMSLGHSQMQIGYADSSLHMQASTSGLQKNQSGTRHHPSRSASERRRRSANHSHRDHRPSTSRRRQHRRGSRSILSKHRRVMAARCSSKRCHDYDVESDVDDYSSQCSTCSSLSDRSYTSDSNLDSDDYTSSSDCDSTYSYDSNDEFTSSYTSSCTESSNSEFSQDEDDTRDRQVFLRSTYSNKSSRSNSPCSSLSGDEKFYSSSSSRQRRSRRPVTGKSSSVDSRLATSSRHQRASKGTKSRKSRRSSRSSSFSNSTTSSRSKRANKSSNRKPRHTSSRHSRRTDHHEERSSREQSRRSKSHSHRQHDYEKRSRSTMDGQSPSRRREHSRNRNQNSYEEAPTHLVASQHIYPQASQEQQQAHMILARSKSPSVMSTDSKSVKNENCRVI